MQRGEAYFLEADAENNNGGNRLTKQTALNWLQKYTLRDKDHPVAPWPVSKALNLLAGVRPDACIDTGFDPAFPLAEEDKKLGEALDDASQALALVLNDCEDAKNRKRLMRFFELGRIRFALRINDDVDLLRPEEYFMRIANEKLPLRLYHKVGAVLFSHEYFSRDVPVFGLFHDFTREKDGRAECETVDDQLWQRLQRSLTVEDCREAKSHDVAPWDIPIYKPLPFVEPAFSNNQCSAACSLSPAPPMPDAFLPPPLAPDDCLEVEAPKAPAAVPSASGIEGAGVELSEAIAFGVATRDVLNVLADYLSRPAERQISGNKNFPTKAQCVLDALDAVAKRHKWGRAGDGSGRLSKAQWEGVRALFLPPTKPDAGCKGGRWGGNTDRDT